MLGGDDVEVEVSANGAERTQCHMSKLDIRLVDSRACTHAGAMLGSIGCSDWTVIKMLKHLSGFYTVEHAIHFARRAGFVEPAAPSSAGR